MKLKFAPGAKKDLNANPVQLHNASVTELNYQSSNGLISNSGIAIACAGIVCNGCQSS